MLRSSILAHRGMFLSEFDKNSPNALIRALDEGFGVETDLRDLYGEVVISHDPPRGRPSPTSFHWLLEQIASSPSAGRIGLNIKSDGLSDLIESELKATGLNVDQFFVFDMSVPDAISYFNRQLSLYSRISDYEPLPAFQDKAKGVWIDNFSGSFQQVKRANDFIQKGIRVALVSPELHCRNHESLWNEIMDYGLYTSPLFELCTDFPVQASMQFCTA